MHGKRCLPAIACCLIMMLTGQGAASAAPVIPEGGTAAAPSKGMSMAQVERSFGQPGKVLSAVGEPPITRWVYRGYTVYFDRNHVVHSVTERDAPPAR